MAAEKNALPYDYSGFDDRDEANQSDVLGRISVLADKMHQLDKDLAKAELEVKQLKEKHRQIAEEQLPELFAQVGMSELRTLKGLPLVLKNKIHTNISKGRKAAAIAWLDEHGQGGMIKRSVIIEFDKTQKEKVEALVRLIGRSWPQNYTDLNVHPATVKAFVTRQLKDGKKIPADVFGIHCVDVVEIASKK